MLEHKLLQNGIVIESESPIFDNTDYVVEFIHQLSTTQKVAIGVNYASILVPLSTQHYLLNFGNSVGETEFCGKRYVVKSRKITLDKLDQMLQFVSKKMASLPYQASAPTKFRAKNDTEWEAIFYHQWNDLRQALLEDWDGETLVNCWDFVKLDPHHRLHNETTIRPIWQSKHIGARSMQNIIEHPETWHRISKTNSLAKTSLAKNLSFDDRPYFPAVIQDESINISFDTVENRMMRHILQEMHEITLEMNRKLAKKHFFNHLQIKQTNSDMQNIIEELMQVEWLNEVGDLSHIPAASTVLQKKNGYRQWYSFYQQILMGSNYPLPVEDIKAIVESRDVATIFEYWCYLLMIDVIEQVIGSRPQTFKRYKNSDGFQVLKEGLSISFQISGETLTVFYNKTFSLKKKESYSQTYRPDISLCWKNQLHHFDAKFKLQTAESSSPTKLMRYVKKEDIDKMHTYKDAIKGTQSAWVLLPAEVEGSYLFYKDPRSEDPCRGIGAIGVLPGVSHSLHVVIQNLLNIGE